METIMESPLRVLHLEDSRRDAELIQAMLEAEGISEEEIAADFKRWRAGRRK